MPKQTTSQRIGSLGHSIVEMEIKKSNYWIARNLTEDFGIDIELELAPGEIEGKFIKAQIKSHKYVSTEGDFILDYIILMKWLSGFEPWLNGPTILQDFSKVTSATLPTGKSYSPASKKVSGPLFGGAPFKYELDLVAPEFNLQNFACGFAFNNSSVENLSITGFSSLYRSKCDDNRLIVGHIKTLSLR